MHPDNLEILASLRTSAKKARSAYKNCPYCNKAFPRKTFFDHVSTKHAEHFDFSNSKGS